MIRLEVIPHVQKLISFVLLWKQLNFLGLICTTLVRQVTKQRFLTTFGWDWHINDGAGQLGKQPKKRWQFPSWGGSTQGTVMQLIQLLGSTPFHLFFSFFVYVLNHPEMQRKNFWGGTPPLSGSLGIFPKLGLRIENSWKFSKYFHLFKGEKIFIG